MSNMSTIIFKMADIKFIYIFVLISIKYSTCHKHSIHKRVEKLKNISIQMYGEVVKEYWQFKTQNIDHLLYPSGDKQKLLLLSSLWRDYYDCSLRSLGKLTSHRQVPSMMIMVYTGAVARLPCSVCVAPNERNALQWLYAKSPTNITLTPIQEHERMVVEKSNLTIYNVKMEDAGVYQCEIGDSRNMMLLEVVDDDNYNVVKPSTSRGPYPTLPHTLDCGLTVFSSWSPWSECSVCGQVGRKHRYGICYVKFDHKMRKKSSFDGIVLDKREIGLFEAFPGGIPCRSPYMPPKFREIDAIKQRRNEIMIAMCKVACNDMIHYTRSLTGDVVEIANNSAGIYSLAQLLPKQPPLPARDTIFADFGQRLALRCPGTILRDVPIMWRSGTKLLIPRELDQATNGRMYINSRDHLVITKIFYRDADLYSCWQHNKLAGTVRLIVSSRMFPCAGTLLVLLFAALALLHLIERAAGGGRPVTVI